MSAWTVTDPRWAGFVVAHPAAGPIHHPDWDRLAAGATDFAP
jgi:hypothetical protein